jgi:hypothetical protein
MTPWKTGQGLDHFTGEKTPKGHDEKGDEEKDSGSGCSLGGSGVGDDKTTTTTGKIIFLGCLGR